MSRTTGATVALVAALALTPLAWSVHAPPPAEAAVCGLNKQLEDVPSEGITVSFGIFSFVLGSGQRQIMHYGNCTPNRQSVEVVRADGQRTTGCVTPGDSRLGPAVGSDRIVSATAVGPC